LKDLIAVVRDPKSPYEVAFEDDGRVAYAYLRHDAKIVSDVWLYNSAPTPAQPEWRDRSKMPFLNPQGFVTDKRPPVPSRPEDVSARWVYDGDELKEVEIFLKGELWAKLAPGVKPGWSKAAAKVGPLAKPLV
jgi:hypothetical protein